MLRTHLSATISSLTLAGILLVDGGGCASNGAAGSSAAVRAGDTSSLPASATELAAYAGHAQYPKTQPADKIEVVAIVSRDKKQIKLYNVEKEAVRDVRLWVNGTFVKPIGGIAPSSAVTIKTDELYNGLGHTLASRNEEIAKVQIETNGMLYDVLGHVAE